MARTMYMKKVNLRRPATRTIKMKAIERAPHLKNTIQGMSDEAVARLAEATMGELTQEPSAASPEPDNRGGNIASTVVLPVNVSPYQRGYEGGPGMPLDDGPVRERNPIKLLPGNIGSGSLTSAVITMTPTKRIALFRLVIPSGQGSGVLVGAITASARVMSLDSSQSGSADCLSEKVRNGGRVTVPPLEANSPVTVALSGLATSTTYYAVFFGYVLDEAEPSPPFDGAKYRGERFSYFGSSSISASNNTTLKTTPTEWFQPKRLTFDETVSNFWSAAGVGLLMAAGYPIIADMVEEVASADYPLITHSTVAEDDVVDFDVIRPNTAFNANIKNTNTSQSVTAQGHATGDFWEP